MTTDQSDDSRNPEERLLALFLEAHPEAEAVAFETWVSGREDLRDNPQLAHRLRALFAQWQRAAQLLGEGLSSRRSNLGSFFRAVAKDHAADAERAKSAGLQAGQRIGHFTLRSFIAQGGMGQVWQAHDENLRTDVALKLILPGRIDAHSLDLFAREARAGGRLRHPYIVTTLSTGRADGLTWIAQELVDGSWTLKDYLDQLRTEDTVPKDHYKSVALFVARVADGLQAAHDAGVIHRDVKPANILIAPDDTPRLTDFGLARVVDDSFLSQSGDLAGTWSYMSPEQVRAKRTGLDHRTDIFSLGIVLYELLTLRRPFEGDTAHQIADRIIHFDPPAATKLRSQCPRELAVICGKALEKEQTQRYASMREFSADLHRHLANEPIHARPPGPVALTIKWVQRNPGRAIAVISVVALAVQSSRSRAEMSQNMAKQEATNIKLGDAYLELQKQKSLAEERARSISRTAYTNSLSAAAEALSEGDSNMANRLLLQCSMSQRGWEWEHLKLRLNQPRAVYRDSVAEDVIQVAWSPDGKRFATASGSGLVWIRSTEDGGDVNCFRVRTSARLALAWCPDGQHITTLGNEGLVQLWDLRELPATSELFTKINDLDQDTEGVSLSWWPDGASLDVYQGLDLHSRLSVVGERRLGPIDLDMVDLGYVGAVYDWSSDRRLVALMEYGYLSILNVTSGAFLDGPELLLVARAPGNPFMSWSPAGDLIAALEDYDRLEAYRFEPGESFEFAWSCDCQRSAFAWSSDGLRMTIPKGGASFCVLETGEGHELIRFGEWTDDAGGFAWSPDGITIWAGHTVYHTNNDRAIAWGAHAEVREPAHAWIKDHLERSAADLDLKNAASADSDLSPAVRAEIMRLLNLGAHAVVAEDAR